jgi:hypothetical protein
MSAYAIPGVPYSVSTISSPTGKLIIGNDTQISGNLSVIGTTTTINTAQMLVMDNAISLNNGYTSTTTKACGIVSNYSATATTANIASGGFTAGVAGVSNPTVSISADVFAAGDIIQISGANNIANNGTFEVHSDVAGVLTIRGIGTTGLTYDLLQNQFVTDTTIAGVIYKINTNSIYINGTNTIQLVGANTGSMVSKTLSGVTAATTANTIASFSDTSGTLSSPTTTTAATLARPISVTAGNTGTAASFSTSNTNCFVTISTTGTSTNRGAITFGRAAVGQWTIGSDKDNTNSNNFFVFYSGAQALIINGTNQLITASYGFTSARYDISVVAANPGGTTTLWSNSGDSNRLYQGANRLAYASEIVAGGIAAVSPVVDSMVVFSDASPGNVKSPTATVTTTQSLIMSKTTTTTDTLLTIKRIGTNTTGITTQVIPASDINNVYFNGYQDASTGINYYVAGKTRWGIINDCSGANDLLKIERMSAGVATTPMLINASDSYVQLNAGAIVTPSANSTAGCLIIGQPPSAGSLGTLVIQSMTSPYVGMTFLGFNGYFPGSENRINATKNRWRFGVDQRAATDSMFIDTWNGTTSTSVMTCNTNGIITGNVGMATVRYDISDSASVNPGGAATMWKLLGEARPRFSNLGNYLFSGTTVTTTNRWTQITVPAGAKFLKVTIIGGGGGGGSTNYTGANGGGSSGGGSGARYTGVYLIDSTCTYWVYVGAGGAGGTTASPAGVNGRATYFHIDTTFEHTVWGLFNFPFAPNDFGNTTYQRYTAVVLGGTGGGMTSIQPFGAGGGNGGSMYPLTTAANPANTTGTNKGAQGNFGTVPGQGASGGSVNVGTGGPGGIGGLGYQGGGDGGGGGGYGSATSPYWYGGATPSTSNVFEYNPGGGASGTNTGTSGWGGFGGGVGGGIGANMTYPTLGTVTAAKSGTSPGAGGGGSFGSNSAPYNGVSMSGGAGANGVAYIQFV